MQKVFSPNAEADSDFAAEKPTRFKCVCAYDGTDFRGWQSQLSGDSVQDFFERRLSAIFKKKIRIHGSGRTDAGVHAAAQVFHFDAVWRHDCKALLAALSSGYPDSLQVLKVSKVSADFHARYCAKGKRYVYRMYEGRATPEIVRYRWSLGRRRPDVGAMNEAAAMLVGTRDFTAFSAARRHDSNENTVKTLRKLEFSRRGREIKMVTEGSGYLYKMVRMIVGALVDVGTGKLSKEDIARALESKKRGTLFQAAPAKGLSLEKVFYK